MSKYRVYPGVAVSIFFAAFAYFLNEKLFNIGKTNFAIILGVVAGNMFLKGDRYKKFEKGIKYSGNVFLGIAIIFLGARLNINAILALGLRAVLYIVLISFAGSLAGIWIGNFYGVEEKFSALLGVGGTSSMAAAAPAVDFDVEEFPMLISVVNITGLTGIFLMPIISRALDFDQVQGGFFIGGTLQILAHTIASAYTLGEYAGNLAVLTKMGKMAVLPLLIYYLGYRRNKRERTHKKVGLPYFVKGFLILSVFFSLFHYFEYRGSLAESVTVVINQTEAVLKFASTCFLMAAMTAIGLQTKLRALFSKGVKILLFGYTVLFAQIAVGLVLSLIMF